MLWWTDDLITGVDSVDEQHKSIFEKASDILELGCDSDIDDVKKTFVFLMNYANNHFYAEEVVMFESGYKDFLKHKKEHNYFIEEVYNIYNDILEAGLSENSLSDLKILIINWLVNHINGDDKRFISQMQEAK